MTEICGNSVLERLRGTEVQTVLERGLEFMTHDPSLRVEPVGLSVVPEDLAIDGTQPASMVTS